MSLSLEEVAIAQAMINQKVVGTYELNEIYDSHWSAINSPTTFGKKFKRSVREGKLQNIKLCSLKTNNHHAYEIFRKQ